MLAVWNTFGLQGEHTLRLTGVDRAGNVVVVEERLNFETPDALLSSVEAVPPLFSPNGDGRLETTGVRYGLEAEVMANVVVYAEDGSLVRRLRQETLLTPGTLVDSWDGKRDDGTSAPDGLYSLSVAVVLASNPLVSQTEQVSVVLDRTPPTVSIVTPTGPFERPDFEVFGTIQDVRLEEVEISLTQDPTAAIWTELYRGAEERTDYPFATLTNLEEGDYQIRVVARDVGLIETILVIPFTVDETSPVVALENPADGEVLGAAGGLVEVLGTVEEKHLRVFRLEWGVGSNPGSWTELVLAEPPSDPLPQPLFLWDLTGNSDGPVTLRLVGNRRRR